MPPRPKKKAAKKAAATQPKTETTKPGLDVPFDPLIHRRVLDPRSGTVRVVARDTPRR